MAAFGGKRSGAALRAKVKSLRTRLVVRISDTSGAGTALQTIAAIEPYAAAEFATFQSLFDDIKVHGFELFWNLTTSGSNGNSLAAVVTYTTDSVSSALGSVAEGLTNDTQQLLVIPASGVVSAPVSMTASGFRRMKVVIPKSSAFQSSSGTVVNNFPGSWMALTDVADTTGILRFYVEAAGGSFVTKLIGFIVMDVEFRQRR